MPAHAHPDPGSTASAPSAQDGSRLVLLGVVVGAHGIQGQVKVKSFTADPGAVAGYGPLYDAGGRTAYRLTVTGQAKGTLIVRVDGVRDRNAAEALRGLRLHVPRSALPATGPEEFYHSDLVGLAAETVEGDALGRVRAVHDFGAGDLLEIVPETGGAPLMMPFTRAVVPLVDLAGGRLVVDPPAEIEIRPDSGAEDEAGPS